ncbi:MAG TPA: hypothetical protein VIC26_16490 [Marinagarivorans sp.]
MKNIFASLCAVASLALTPISAMAGTNTDSEKNLTLSKAYTVIQEYRELRESCAAGSYEQRRRCVGELSQASPDYRAAKDVIAKRKGSSSGGESTLASSFN